MRKDKGEGEDQKITAREETKIKHTLVVAFQMPLLID